MGPGAQHGNRQHPPTKPQDSLVVLVGVELAVPAGEGVATLAKQHKGLVLVHVAIHRALTVPRLGWSWGMGSMKRELILTVSNSRSRQRSMAQNSIAFLNSSLINQKGQHAQIGRASCRERVSSPV